MWLIEIFFYSEFRNVFLETQLLIDSAICIFSIAVKVEKNLCQVYFSYELLQIYLLLIITDCCRSVLCKQQQKILVISISENLINQKK